jgi:hypothetical protein
MLGGIVDSANTSCEGGQTVRIHRAPVGSDFQEIGSVVTGSDGSYAFETTPAETATYRATVDGSSSCQAATSSDEVVRVRVKVTLSVSDRRVSKGDKVRLTATVAPCADHNTTEVALMRSFGKRFKEIARKDLDAHCKASFKNKVKRDSAFKAKWPSQDNDHEGNSSKERVVQVKGR